MNKLIQAMYYGVQPFVSRKCLLSIRKCYVLYKRLFHRADWPILEKAAVPPAKWKGWPQRKQFALVLTHDVDTRRGQERCRQLISLEQKLGFRSSFNFVPEDYADDEILRHELVEKGFEVGVHGLKHKGNMFRSRQVFMGMAQQINHYLDKWNAVGFRAPSMYHNLEWIQHLDIEYDSSTFDTDPFEPQPDGVKTIFPFQFRRDTSREGYVELPYTLPQDFALFIMMGEKNIDIWKRKVDWICLKGGMALINTHPDYMYFGDGKTGGEDYPAEFYEEFLAYVKSRYEGAFWHALPKDVARFWAGGTWHANTEHATTQPRPVREGTLRDLAGNGP